jgi:hypothetical protein
VGTGYGPSFFGSKNLRDAECGVEIRFLVSGDTLRNCREQLFPIPDPSGISVELDGIMYVKLPALVEMKLSSGIRRPDRIKDLADVQELIKALQLSDDFADQLDPLVRNKYLELWSPTARAHQDQTAHSKLPAPHSPSH